jgi:hypothetical protein
MYFFLVLPKQKKGENLIFKIYHSFEMNKKTKVFDLYNFQSFFEEIIEEIFLKKRKATVTSDYFFL